MKILHDRIFLGLTLLICLFASVGIVRASEVAQAINPPLEITVLPLLKEKVCMSCHLMDKKRVGPSLLMIAERYAEQGEEFIPVLSERIVTGGKGHWGPLSMPAQNKVSWEEAQIMARWILSLGAKATVLESEAEKLGAQ